MVQPVKKPPPPIDEAPPIEELSPRRSQMQSAPKDGRWIEVTNDDTTWLKARWYETRVRAAGSVAWVKASCWSTSEPSKLAHCVKEPTSWRPIEA